MSDEKLINEAAKVAYAAYFPGREDWVPAQQWLRVAESQRDFWAAHTEPASVAMRERLDRAKDALIETGYFTRGQVCDDIAPRIIELFANRFNEPASGDVTLVQALRMVRQHAEKVCPFDALGHVQMDHQWLYKEADRLEAAESEREADIRIGRRFLAKTNVVSQAPFGSDEHAAFVGAHIREAVEAERGEGK